MESQELDISKILKERFALLPKVVQQSILSSQVEEHLRALAQKHKLHLDQGVSLENEVMMVLLGLRPITELATHIQEETNSTKEQAETIALDASQLIFEPIRQELERELKNPNVQPEEVSPEEAARQQMIAEGHADAEGSTSSDAPRSVHATPSSVRTTIEGDPYREALK